MATSTIPMLPQAISITGAEQLEAVQAGTSVRVTAAQIAALATPLPSAGPTGVALDAPTGTLNDYTIAGQMGATIGFADLSPPSTCVITGILAGFDGQLLTVSNLTANSLTLDALSGSSQAANQLRMTANVTLAQYQGITFRYSASIGLWVHL